MGKLKDDLVKMSTYEHHKIKVDYFRLLATLLAPPMVVILQRVAKVYLGW